MSNLSFEALPRCLLLLVIEAEPLNIYPTEAEPQPNFVITLNYQRDFRLAPEVSFYLLLPFLFSRIKNTNQALSFFIVSLIIKLFLHLALSVCFHKFNYLGGDEFLFYYLPSQMPIFALGILMYFIVYDGVMIDRNSGKSFLMISLLFIFQLVTKHSLIMSKHILYGIVFLFFGVALSKFHFKLVVNPVLTYVGKISYSLYLTYFAVLFWFGKMDLFVKTSNLVYNLGFRFFIVLFVSVLLSTFFYYCIEIPFQKIGSKIISKI